MPGKVEETREAAAAPDSSSSTSSSSAPFCSNVPALVSDFVDSFVDFVVGGQFLGSSSSATSFSVNQKTSSSTASFATTRLDEEEEVDGNQQGKNSSKVEESSEMGRRGRMLSTWLPAPERLIAIGDIHGDLSKARAALRVAQVLDANDHWIGGKTVVVQVGDLLDRGGEELKVIYLLEKLKLEAQSAGGDVHVLNGNHEIMNMEGDFRIPVSYPEGLRARIAALRPGGPISSRFLANHHTVLVVGSSVFVHGGLLPAHMDYGLEHINQEVRDWMLGKNGWRGPSYLHGANAIVWLRKYSDVKESRCDCELLNEAIASIPGAQRMVVGHTIQDRRGINSICNDTVIRVDVGLSKGCGDGEPQVLEIMNDRELRVLSAHSPLQFINAGNTTKNGIAIKDKDKIGLLSLLPDNPQRYV
ncbi:hypothetical protein CY35_15G043600 [Sphagnum magellanicum]|nr:hypothetical protein CY35_15G043600 [Sphagnum magellanicum]